MGGITGAVGATGAQFASQLTSYSIDGVSYSIPGHNTINYLTGASAAKMASNVITGQPVFKNIANVVWNPGVLLPMAVDAAEISIPLFLNTKMGSRILANKIKNRFPEVIDNLAFKDLRVRKIDIGPMDKDYYGITIDYMTDLEASFVFGDKHYVELGFSGQYTTTNTLAFLGFHPISMVLSSKLNYYTYHNLYMNLFRKF